MVKTDNIDQDTINKLKAEAPPLINSDNQQQDEIQNEDNQATTIGQVEMPQKEGMTLLDKKIGSQVTFYFGDKAYFKDKFI